MQELTREGLIGLLKTEGQNDAVYVSDALAMIAEWGKRGDGVAVYRNEELGHPELGRLKFYSYGSEAAQLRVLEGYNPPTILPDIGTDINWRYVLVGTYGRKGATA